mmetsp:Transcript_35579/g.84946  ORF Transcript_35579/g.84946 Transcript_35579/m.84946 type:complete len:93 (+) Transcript_35579:1890-2168(+)
MRRVKKKLKCKLLIEKHYLRLLRTSICLGIESSEIECAAIIPDPLTAGTPIPGKQLSPHRRRLFTGVFGNGNDASAAFIAGPYEPRYLFKKR